MMRLSLKKCINELFDDTVSIKKVGDVDTSFTINLDSKRSVDYTVWIGYDKSPKEAIRMISKYMDKHGIEKVSTQEAADYVYDITFTADKAKGFDDLDIKGAKRVSGDKWDLENEIDALSIGDVKHSLKVFGTVYQIVSKWVKKFHSSVIGLSFAATTREPGRIKLYRRMSKSMAGKIGFEFIGETKVSADSGNYFIFVNKEFLK